MKGQTEPAICSFVAMCLRDLRLGAETRSLQVPEDTVLPHSVITLPHIFVGDGAYLLTTYLTFKNRASCI